MAETPPKRKAKPKRGEQSVLGTLPASRPERLGRPRRHAEVSRARQAAPDTAGAPARTASAKRAATTANGHAGKARAPAKRVEVSRARQARPDTAGAPAGRSGKPPAANGAKSAARPRPKAVRPASPPLRATRATDAPPPKPIGAPTGTELVTTTIRAAGELAQIGFTVGGRVLKRTIDRIPRP